MLFLATERNKLIILGQLKVLKQRSLHSFRNILLSEVKQGRPGLLVQFTGFFPLIYPGIPSIRLYSGSPPETAYEVVLYLPPYTQTTRVKILCRNIKL